MQQWNCSKKLLWAITTILKINLTECKTIYSIHLQSLLQLCSKSWHHSAKDCITITYTTHSFISAQYNYFITIFPRIEEEKSGFICSPYTKLHIVYKSTHLSFTTSSVSPTSCWKLYWYTARSNCNYQYTPNTIKKWGYISFHCRVKNETLTV
jgi:hypothetical protein